MYNLCEKQIHEDSLSAQISLEVRTVGNVYVLFGNTYAKESTHISIKPGSMIEFKGGLDSINLKEN